MPDLIHDVMWQRIQTLYLAIATILVGSMFFCNFGKILGPDGAVETFRYTHYLAWLLFLISMLSANCIALFSFRTRMLQMRVTILAALLLIGFQVWIAVKFFQMKDVMVFSFTAVFPIVAAILDFLAARNIFLDEAMVQSASRLRSRKK